jgi:hypothetical protein
MVKKAASLILGAGLIFMVTEPLCADHGTTVQIEVVDNTMTQHTGPAMEGGHVFQRETLKAVIAQEHVLLQCKSDSCESLQPGNYSGEKHGSSLRVDFEQPLTGKHKHNEYRIVGGW